MYGGAGSQGEGEWWVQGDLGPPCRSKTSPWSELSFLESSSIYDSWERLKEEKEVQPYPALRAPIQQKTLSVNLTS